MTVVESERREFFRIQDHLLIEFRQISEEESKSFLRDFQQIDSSQTLLPDDIVKTLVKTGAVRDDVYAYLETIDKKLNIIIDLLTKKADLFQGRSMDVSLSGSGIRFLSDTQLNEGVFVELRITMPQFPNPRITVLGQVIRSVMGNLDGKEAWETGITYVAIKEKDRDLLVNYIFSREREHLRKKQGL
jgi:hypothetical protein